MHLRVAQRCVDERQHIVAVDPAHHLLAAAHAPAHAQANRQQQGGSAPPGPSTTPRRSTTWRTPSAWAFGRSRFPAHAQFGHEAAARGTGFGQHFVRGRTP